MFDCSADGRSSVRLPRFLLPFLTATALGAATGVALAQTLEQEARYCLADCTARGSEGEYCGAVCDYSDVVRQPPEGLIDSRCVSTALRRAAGCATAGFTAEKNNPSGSIHFRICKNQILRVDVGWRASVLAGAGMLVCLGYGLPAGAAVGSTEANYGVTANGAPVYTIPIQVTIGTAGMTPRLAISWIVAGQRSLLGMRFTIAGCKRWRAAMNPIGAAPHQEFFHRVEIFR